MLSKDEARQIEEAIASDPSLKEEAEAIESNLLDYAKAHAVRPPENLKSKVFKRLTEEGYPTSKVRNISNDNKQSTTGFRGRIWLYAASFALLFSLALNFYQHQLNQDLRGNLDEVTAAYEELLQDEVRWTHTVSDLESTIESLAYSSKSIELQAQPGFEGLQARVFWDNTSGQTFLAPINLPALPQDETYQLWIIQDGVPVSLGIFETEKDSIIRIDESVFNADAFAVSIEPDGGSLQPTVDQICLIGAIAG